MFQHNWSESATINLNTVPAEYMEPIVDYLYSSDFIGLFLDSPQNYSENFIFQMLTICDQFFIEQLRYNFEVLVLERFSIRNCGEILEFACSFNCDKLERACIEYICFNLDRVLENQSLVHLDTEILTKINERYRELFPEVGYRMITPYMDAVSDEVLESFVDDFHVDLGRKKDENGERLSQDKQAKKLKFRENKITLDRRQYEKEAIAMIKEITIEDHRPERTGEHKSSVVHDDKFQFESSKVWTKVAEKKSPGTVDVKVRKPNLSVLKANVILKNEEKPASKYTNLNEIFASNVIKLESVEGPLKSPPVENVDVVSRSSINLGDFTPVKGTKLSQKQRKRLSSESQQKLVSSPISIESPSTIWNDTLSVIASPESVWGSVNNGTPNFSLATIMKSNENGRKSSTPVEVQSSKNSQTIHGTTSQSPATATGYFPFSPVLNQTVKNGRDGSDIFTIQRDEREQKEYYEKMKSKSLILTQIEETAIEELSRFYNVENTYDESIRVERQSKMTVNFAVWNHQK